MRIRRLFTVAALTAILLAGACDQVNFTAPTGSVITLTVQPQTIAVNGFANLTVTGTRESGAPLPDGTTIDFTSDLGTVTPNPVETKDGVARTQLKAGTRSGTAHVTARSGSAAEVSVDVIVGEARASRLTLVATPIQLPVGGGKVNLKAHVFDDQGNTLGGVGVIFITTTGQLESRGRVVKTNDSGTAFDTLRTTIAASITAESQNGAATDTEEITIGEGVPCGFVFNPGNPTVGQPVIFTDTSGITNGVQFLWDFGDGTTDEGQTVSHIYAQQGTFNVIHTVVDSQGFSSVCDPVPVTVSRGEPTCSISASDPNPVPGQVVTFDASDSTDIDGIIVSYTFNFHDGTQVVTQGTPVISHSFALIGTFTVELTVTDDTGLETTCVTEVFVDPNN